MRRGAGFRHHQVPPVRPRRRPGSGVHHRHGHLRFAVGAKRTVAGQRGRRRGQPGQERISGQDEPRDQNAHELHHRADQDHPANQARRRTARPSGNRARIRHVASGADQRHPRSFQNRGQGPVPGGGGHKPAPGGGGGREVPQDPGPEKKSASGGLLRTKDPSLRACRRPASASGSCQPGGQRHQIHGFGRGTCACGAVAPVHVSPGEPPRRPAPSFHRARHRGGHRAGQVGNDIHALPAGRRLGHPPPWRDGAGAYHLPSAGRAHGRQHLGGKRGGPGQPVFVRHVCGGGRSGQGPGGPAYRG
ncbi:basic proline-rich protein precursor [hydrocarbon metagenome]|uniref:Basic proline-rich protein n=1 Tax=hydrocarbon metagenome TaxID=938273 RepID=A0A0W8G564_9ZZZZ